MGEPVSSLGAGVSTCICGPGLSLPLTVDIRLCADTYDKFLWTQSSYGLMMELKNYQTDQVGNLLSTW